MGTQFSRQELYDLVWSQPMIALSKKFGISDVGLAKACRRVNIPIPPRGYWNKVQAGKVVTKTALPDRLLGQSEYTQFGGNTWERHEINLEKGPPTFDETLEEVIAKARVVSSRVTIPKTLAKPHPLVAKLLAADEQRRAKNSTWSWERPLFDSSLEKRRLRILNGIFSALQQANCSADIRGKEAREISCVVGDQRLSVKLEPINHRQRDNWERGVLKEDGSVELKLEVYQYHEFPKEFPNAWIDSSDKTLEEQLPEIVHGILVLGELQYRYHEMYFYECRLEEQRRADAEMQRQQEETERKHQEEMQLALERKRAHLVEQAVNWKTASDIRNFVSAMENHPDLNDPQSKNAFEGWKVWALKEAESVDPLCSDIDKVIGTSCQ